MHEYAGKAGLPAVDVNEVKMAVDEACSNVIEHAYEGDDSQQIEVEVSVDNQQLVITIRDCGLAFDQESYREPKVQQLVEQRQSGGLGVYLIHQLMDDVEYNSQGSVNEVRLVKNINSTS